MRSEVKVGVFVFIGILLLFFLTTQVGSFKNYSKEGYTLFAALDNAAGLEPNSKIKANGIDVGYIKSLSITGNKIRAKLFINKGVKIPDNSTLTPMQESMLGGKYAGIALGDSQSFLSAGSTVASAKALASINKASDSMAEAADEFKAFIVDFRKVFDPHSRDNLRETFSNLEAITHELKEFVKLNKLNKIAENFNAMTSNLSKTADTVNARLPTIMRNLDDLVKDLKVASSQLKTKLPALADKYSQIGDNIQAIIHENKKPLNASLTSANTFFSSGEDAFDKVDALLDNIDKVQLEVAMRSEWMAKDSYNKGYLSLDYRPNDTKTYKFDIAGMEDYSRLDENNVLIEPALHEKTDLLISAQIAKRFDDVAIRAGLIENTFGGGLDYYMLDDTLKASTELFDMNAENDVRGDNPHVKVSARYTFLKHLDLYGGVDNFLNADATNTFVGLGVRFYDDDLKTLIMAQSLSSLAQ